MNAGAAELRADALWRRRGERVLLRDVSVAFGAGRLTALVGGNGAGKTTLLQLLAGHPPDAGVVLMNGVPVVGQDAGVVARRRAVLPQSDELNVPFSVREVVELAFSPFAGVVAAPELARAADEVMRRLDVAGLARRVYLSLSGGEKQRTRVARVVLQALCGRDGPRYLLLDEPMTALDVAWQHEVMRYLKELAACGYGVVAVVHDLNLARRYADDVCLLRHGRIAACGEAARVLDERNIREVFDVDVALIESPALASPAIVVRG